MATYLVSADFVGAGDFFTLDQASSEYLFIGSVMLHSADGRVLLATNYSPNVSIWGSSFVSSAGTTTIHYSSAAIEGTVFVEGTLRNSHHDGAALRIWSATSRTEVLTKGLILANGAAGTAIELSVQSPNTTAEIINRGTIDGHIAINRSGSEGVQITNSGRIQADGGLAFQDLFGGVDVIYNTGTISGQINFGGGHDVYNGQSGILTGRIFAGAGDDVLRAGANNAYFYGEAGDDEISGGVGNDQIYAGADNDSVWGGGGNDIIEGWSGNDALYGDEGRDLFYGNTGNDSIAGGLGDDTLWGQEDNDLLYGDAGTDTMHGGSGDDKFYVDILSDVVVEEVGGGTDQVIASGHYRLAVGAEVETLSTSGGVAITNLVGNEFGQRILGNGGINTLNGLGGNDTVSALGGNDYLYGGLGNDRLIGGLGNDNFVFNTALNAVTNKDTINDFKNVSGDNDTIRLDNSIFTKLATTGALNAAFFKANATGIATDANDYIVYNTTTGALSYDSNGNAAGGAVQFAILTGHPALTTADFFVI